MSRCAALILCAIFILCPSWAVAETVAFPFFIDFPLLKRLVLQTAFDGPDQSAIVLDKNKKCQRIVLSDPTFREKEDLVYLETGLYARMGAFVEPECILPIEYTGHLTVLLRPVIDRSWILRFYPKDVTLYENEGPPHQPSPAISPLMNRAVSEYIEAIAFDLRPSIDQVKAFILPLIPASHRNQAKKMLQSMQPAGIQTTAKGLRMRIEAQVDVVYEDEADDKALTELELEAIVRTWEAMDAFLVQLMTSMTDTPLSVSDKHALASALLESRYDFVMQWSEGTLGNDFVREQFKGIWQKISKIIRHHLNEESPNSALRYLAFYTASEALSILDKIGPSLGINISREGLLRLARLLSGDSSTQLIYQSRINRRLRDIFGLGKTLPPPPKVIEKPCLEPDIDEKPPQESQSKPTSWLIQKLSPARAWAQIGEKKVNHPAINKWLLRPDNADTYFKSVRKLLNDASHRVLKNPGKTPNGTSFFNRLILAVAWQESCFKQFTVNNQKIVFIRSYNGTSVGLMQINERVWRGLYDIQALRWDIQYNAQAGCEILALYLQQYALPEIDLKGEEDNDTLARLVYALYNGGPGQLSKFMNRHEHKKYFLSDRLFNEKYRWVTQGAWRKLNQCVTGS